jgi:mannose-6-phosphate isomerase-like protein (cupin superfamily)
VGGDIGLEMHPDTDQFLRLEAGSGLLHMGAEQERLTLAQDIGDGWCAVVPAGTWHNITNIGADPMRLYAVYAPAHHAPGKVHPAPVMPAPIRRMSLPTGRSKPRMPLTNRAEGRCDLP